MAGQYNRQDDYSSYGIPGVMPQLHSIRIADRFGKAFQATAQKLSSDREKVSLQEQKLNETFKIYQDKLTEKDMPYFNELTAKVKKRIKDNPFDVPLAMQLAGEFFSDKQLADRMKYNDQDKAYREKIQTMQGIGPATKRWWLKKHKPDFQPIYDNDGNYIGAKDYQYSNELPLEDINWVEESRKLFTLVSPERYANKTTTGSTNDVLNSDDVYWRKGGEHVGWKDTKRLDEKRLKAALEIWYDQNKDRVAQMWRRDMDRYYELKEEINNPNLSDYERKQLKEEYDEYDRIFTKTKAGNLKEYAAYVLTDGSYAHVFSYTDIDTGSANTSGNTYVGSKSKGSSGLSDEDLEEMERQQEEENRNKFITKGAATSVSFSDLITIGNAANQVKQYYKYESK